jgi:hypothetical protein
MGKLLVPLLVVSCPMPYLKSLILSGSDVGLLTAAVTDVSLTTHARVATRSIIMLVRWLSGNLVAPGLGLLWHGWTLQTRFESSIEA